MAVIVGVGGLQNWPELIATFTTCLESNDKNSLEGALDALYKVSSSPCKGRVKAKLCIGLACHYKGPLLWNGIPLETSLPFQDESDCVMIIQYTVGLTIETRTSISTWLAQWHQIKCHSHV